MRLLFFLPVLLLLNNYLLAQEKRLALVIGNSQYSHSNNLANPINDAKDMATALKRLGFEVILKKNLSLNEMRETVDDFGERLIKYDVGLFYFAGHGLQANNKNYLLPVDANPKKESEVEYHGLKVDRVLAQLEDNTKGTNIIILDACRNNPFERSWGRSGRDRGFRVMSSPLGSVIAYSTAPGTVASDGNGRNGHYTNFLLKHIEEPNIPVSLMFQKVRADMIQAYGTSQRPWESSSLLKSFYFNKKENLSLINVDTTALSKEVVPPPKDLPWLELVFVEGGTFNMGSHEGRVDEKPVHEVQVGDFFIGKYEVTQAQWQRVMGTNPSHFKNCDQCPVENVSWNDIQEFLNKLNQQTGENYRLPTEAEWEYAAKGGNNSRGFKYAGSNTLDNVAWYVNNSRSKSHRVGQKSPNELGIYDMSGNVYEWCSNYYGQDYYSSRLRSNPQGPSSGEYRVLRGGSWDLSTFSCRVANRNRVNPHIRVSYFYGFRVVRDL